MLLICPQCFHARPEPLKATGFDCDHCGHRWEPLDGQFSHAYYASVGEVEVSLLTEDGDRFLLSQLPTVIGRDSDFFFLHNNLAISRSHCEIGFDELQNTFFVRDVGSSGGTHVDQLHVPPRQEVPIRPGQHLRLSGVPLRLDVRLRQPGFSVGSIPPAALAISLASLSSHGVLYDSEAAPLAVLHHVSGREIWRILALNRQMVRLNGEIFIERDLQPFDQLTLGAKNYLYDPNADALVPETLQAGPNIALRNIKLTIHDRVILNGITCEIPGGQLSAVIGQSGSGKSTLLKILSGTMLPDAGEIFVNGQPLSWSAYGTWAQKHLALVPQGDVIHGELTVLECLEYAAALQLGTSTPAAEKRERIGKIVHELGLREHQHQRIQTLSGGQRKRVNVAVELLAAPGLLLLDEPTTGLDYRNEEELVSRLRKLARQGRTVVFVTHSLASLDQVDHVLFIHAETDGGRILAEGKADIVLQRMHDHENSRTNAQSGRKTDSEAVGKVAVRLPRTAALTLRYCRIWLSSPGTFFAFLLVLPLVLGLLIRMAVSADGRLGTDRLLFGLIAAFWLGMNQSVREIVREKDIFLREQNRGISCFSFLFSKLVFFLVTALPQSVLITLPIKWLAVEEFTLRFSLRELDCPWSLLIAFFWLSDMLGCVVGLFLSSLCLFVRQKGEIAAVLLVILVTLPQFLFSAKTLPEGLTREPQHYHQFVLWHEEALLPELCSYGTVTRYLFLPLDAVTNQAPGLSRIFRFNLTVLGTCAACLTILTWLTLELYVRWHKRIG